LKLALCSLNLGEPRKALRWIIGPIRYTLSYYRAEDPDPIEWAYFIISLLCAGRVREAQRRANQFSQLHHPELDRARAAVHALRTSTSLEEFLPTNRCRTSIHTLASRSADEWVRDICSMLEACNRSDLAKRLKAARFDSCGSNSRLLGCRRNVARPLRLPIFALQRRATLRYLDNPLLCEAVLTRGAELCRRVCRAIERAARLFGARGAVV
jgi:hypothetical protein